MSEAMTKAEIIEILRYRFKRERDRAVDAEKSGDGNSYYAGMCFGYSEAYMECIDLLEEMKNE